MSKKRKILISICAIVGVLAAAIGITTALMRDQIKAGRQLYSIIESSGTIKVRYNITYKNDSVDNILNKIVNANTGYIEGEKNGNEYYGKCYADGEETPFLEVYRNSDKLMFNVFTTFNFINEKIKENTEYSLDKVSFLVKNGFITYEQLMYLLNIDWGETKVDIPGIAGTIIKIKKCGVPQNSKFDNLKSNMTYYKVPNSYTKKPVIVGMTDDNDNKEFYFCMDNDVVTFEILADIDTMEKPQIDKPEKTFSNEEIEVVKGLIDKVIDKIK